jgi:hypothetical protein
MATTWHPYTIPSTPDVGAGEHYVLSAMEGAQSGKNPSQYLEWREVAVGGGGGGGCVGLALYVKTVGTPPNTTQQVWVGAGTVAGQLPSGFSPTDGKNIANGGSGNVWAEVNIDQETGEIVSVVVDGGSTTPENSDTAFYYTLGYYEYDGESPVVTNYGCGSIDVTVCRNWFAAESPFYGVTLTRCGCGGGGGGY